jgi:hypothetical protein
VSFYSLESAAMVAAERANLEIVQFLEELGATRQIATDIDEVRSRSNQHGDGKRRQYSSERELINLVALPPAAKLISVKSSSNSSNCNSDSIVFTISQ